MQIYVKAIYDLIRSRKTDGVTHQNNIVPHLFSQALCVQQIKVDLTFYILTS